MTVNRRAFILGTSAIAIAAAFGSRLMPKHQEPTDAPNVEAIRAFLAEEFGPKVGDSEETLRFAEDALRFVEDSIPEEVLVFAFIRATNVIRTLETDDDLIFLSIAPPLDAPCQNTLSAAWL